MSRYYRLMLGKSSSHFEEYFKKKLIGIDFANQIDLTNESDQSLKDWRLFNKKYIPVYQQHTGNTSKVSSGLACVKLWYLKYGFQIGDIVLIPHNDVYHIAEINSEYIYDHTLSLTHCRKVKWLGKIERRIFPQNIKNSMGATHTIVDLKKYNEEISTIIETSIQSSDFESVEIKKEIEGEKVLLYEVTDKSLEWKKIKVYNDYNDMQLVYEVVNCEEFTYVMYDKAHETIKIGKTKNDPESRLSQLRTGNPSIVLLHTFPSSLYPEKELHVKFSDYQKDLEWFFYTKGLKLFISEEQKKHKKIIESYQKRQELDKSEYEVFEILNQE